MHQKGLDTPLGRAGSSFQEVLDSAPRVFILSLDIGYSNVKLLR